MRELPQHLETVQIQKNNTTLIYNAPHITPHYTNIHGTYNFIANAFQ